MVLTQAIFQVIWEYRKMIKNIIFLDIDEVLCTNRSRYIYDRTTALDEISCRFLLKLCEEFNCKIVIHSSWRLYKDGIDLFLEEVNSTLPELLEYIMDGHKKRATNPEIYDRLESIDDWLFKYSEEEHVANFIIIDDYQLEFNKDTEYLMDSFIKIKNPNVGFDFPEYWTARKMLKEED